ncbi:MAG: hypothetical protein NTY19_50405 [Planctomycetota bacterium]|nr:hypothetical protein [Planctomycetota bacterium]
MPDEYREPLPDRCPPGEAQEIGASIHVFRLVKTSQVTEEDFMSQRALSPKATFRVDECFARGLSVWATQTEADNARKLPKLRSMRVCRVELCAGAGKLRQTFKPDHRTWWPLGGFPILSYCEVVS